MWKTWHEWEADAPDQESVLREIARHMKDAWAYRDKTGNVRFKAGHQLAYKGWKFGGGLVDLSDGVAIPAIKALRALIIAGRYDWFEQAADHAPGQPATIADAPSEHEAVWLARLCGAGTTFGRIKVDGAEVWMWPEPAGWRVVAVFVTDAEKSGIKDMMLLAKAGSGGCALAAFAPLACLSVVVLIALLHQSIQTRRGGVTDQ
jgi:hypothetical protein